MITEGQKILAGMSTYAFNVYCRELAPGTVSLTGDRAQGDDSKHCAYNSPYLDAYFHLIFMQVRPEFFY